MPVNPTRQYALTQNVSIIVASPNPSRKFIAFANVDANNIAYVSNIQSDGANGFPVMPRSYIGFEVTADKIDVTQHWYAYTTAAGCTINVIEGMYEGLVKTPLAVISTRAWR